MTRPVLCVIQARMESTRLPGKVLLKLGGETLLSRAIRLGNEAFPTRVVVATTRYMENAPILAECRRVGAECFLYGEGPESDVLGRFKSCARRYLWHPDAVVFRYTPDDWDKDPATMRRVANGERLPVEQGGEAFTLRMLDAAQPTSAELKEHLTYALFGRDHPAPSPPPRKDGAPWSIDTQADYDAVRRIVEGH